MVSRDLVRLIHGSLAIVVCSLMAGLNLAQDLRPPQQPAAGREWAKPSELRSKKLIDAGIYTMDSKVNASWLAEHPEFTTRHPFDGIAIRLPLSAEWCKKEGLPEGTQFDDVVWKTRPVPFEAVSATIADLNRTKWGQLTDNFLWWNLRGGVDELKSADLDSADDWKVIEHNAALAARICKESGVKGLLFDTEQYGAYPGTTFAYPFGKSKPDVVRKRGQAWIRAVQKECPDIVVLFTFGWAPDLEAAKFLAGVKEFINGVLDGIEGNARLVHGYENTFYYGQVAGSRFTNHGFRGDRARYDEAVASMREWSSYCSDLKKFKSHVRIGMAAWLESDPWNLWSGWPSGTKDTIWSNLPLALATSEEYVWLWSEHTNFLHTHTDPLPGQTGLNPYLASLANQTFNTGREAAPKIEEDFATNPLANGWYFDFDMLEVGRRRQPEHTGLSMPADAVPYRWNPDKKHLLVSNAWTRGPESNESAEHDRQRRRFVHPIQEAKQTSTFDAAIEFDIESIGADFNNPMIMGLFHADQPADHMSISLRIADANSAIVLAGKDGIWGSKPGRKIEASHKYRFAVTLDGTTGFLHAQLTRIEDSTVACELSGRIPTNIQEFSFNEIGVAQPDWLTTKTSPRNAHSYHVTQVRYEAKTSRN